MAARTYFAIGNTSGGFESFLSEHLPTGRICCLRGAPGTGKGAVLRAMGEKWQQAGRDVTYFACANAPDSLDAVVSGELAMVLDHDAQCASRADAVIDLGLCLDKAALRQAQAEGQALTRRAGMLYQRAFRCLAAAQAAQADTAAIYAAALDTGALCNVRLELTRFLQGAPGQEKRVFAQAITPQGVISQWDSLLRPNTLCLSLPEGFDADAVLYPLAVGLYARGVGYISAMQPLQAGRMAHLCTDTHAVVSFVEPGCEVRTLPFDEALIRREREALAFNKAGYELWQQQAMEALSAAQNCHARLERLCRDAVNPRLQQELCQSAQAVFD